MKFIEITKGEKAIVDDKDFEELNKIKWQWSVGYARHPGYGAHKIRKSILMHRLIMNAPKGMDIDHINGNRLDNRRENLRVCTRAENNQHRTNKRKNKTSIYKGVCLVTSRYFSKRKKILTKRTSWMASIQKNKEFTIIGCFQNELHAAMAYDLWAKELHGEFVQLNFKSI